MKNYFLITIVHLYFIIIENMSNNYPNRINLTHRSSKLKITSNCILEKGFWRDSCLCKNQDKQFVADQGAERRSWYALLGEKLAIFYL